MQQDKNNGLNDPVLDNRREKEHTVLCKNCKQRVTPVNMMCPECSHYINEDRVIHQPLDAKTTRKVRLIVGVVMITIFVVLSALGVIKLRACDNSEALMPVTTRAALSAADAHAEYVNWQF